jgi:hypothetical protein
LATRENPRPLLRERVASAREPGEGMRTYTIHHRAGANGDDVVVIKEGFSWGAFIFNFLWALWHRLWLAFLVLLVVMLAIDAAADLLGLNQALASVIGLAVSLWVGFSANDWRRRALERRGYELGAVVAAQDGDAALRRFVDLAPPGTVVV